MIAHNESFLIYESATGDLFIHFPNSDGSWGKAVNMAEKLESAESQDRFPRLSNDGKYLFFVRHELVNGRWTNGDFYWVDAKVINQIATKK